MRHSRADRLEPEQRDILGRQTLPFHGFDGLVDGVVNQVCGHQRLTRRAVAAHDHMACAVDSLELVGDVGDQLGGTEHAQLQHDETLIAGEHGVRVSSANDPEGGAVLLADRHPPKLVVGSLERVREGGHRLDTNVLRARRREDLGHRISLGVVHLDRPTAAA